MGKVQHGNRIIIQSVQNHSGLISTGSGGRNMKLNTLPCSIGVKNARNLSHALTGLCILSLGLSLLPPSKCGVQIMKLPVT